MNSHKGSATLIDDIAEQAFERKTSNLDPEIKRALISLKPFQNLTVIPERSDPIEFFKGCEVKINNIKS